MRSFLLGLLLLGVFGALVGAVLTWPEATSDVAGNSPTLSEFQTGVRIAQAAGVPGQRTLAASARPERMANSDMPAAEQLAIVAMNDAGAAGGSLPEIGLPQRPTPDIPRQQEAPAGAVVARAASPAHTATAALAPATDPPGEPKGPSAHADPPRQGHPQNGGEALALGMPKPATRTQDDRAANGPHRAPVSGLHVERISIYHGRDDRSETDAQRIASLLSTAGLTTVEMHTTTRGTRSPFVRYFAKEDAAAARSLAKLLGSKTTIWRTVDCTSCRRKPEQGTLQLWPATTTPTRQNPTKGRSH
jgi:hypothetical protein